MNPGDVVQRQFEAANAHDTERFSAEFAEDAQVFAPPAVDPTLVGKPAIAEYYRTRRFNVPALRYELLNRMVMGDIVVDHERVLGLQPDPLEVVLVYHVLHGLVQTVWLFRPTAPTLTRPGRA